MTERTPEEIAAGLTEAQRQVIVEAEENGQRTFWRIHDRYRHGPRRCHRIRWTTLVALVEAGVIAFGPPRLTDPLGLAVRTLIEKESRRG